MSAPTARIEGKCPVTETSGHQGVAPVDVCLTPVGPNLVPIPYVNRAQAKELRHGSTTVRIDGAQVMLAGSQLRPSTGNEAGTGGGIASRVTRGPCEALQTSMCVRIEGAHVVRAGDVTLQNGKNAMGSIR